MNDGDGKAKRPSKVVDLLVLSAIFTFALIVHGCTGDFNKRLNTYNDELRYVSIARSLAMGHGITIRGNPTSFQKIAYPLAIAPFFKLKNPVLRMRLINWFNCLLVLSSVFFAWLIGGELGLERKYRYWLALLTSLWPETFVTMTFMSENLFWPLSLLFVWLWIRNERTPKTISFMALGIICYLTYLCKEIFLAMFIAVSLLYVTGLPHSGLRPHVKIRRTLLFAVPFLICFFAMKLTIFRGLGNSYNQTDFKAFVSVYKVSYMAYAFLYLLSAFMLSVLIVPVVYPMANYPQLDVSSKRLLILNVTFMVLALGVVAWTISTRENLGHLAPRIHMRYFAPFIVVFLAVFASYFQQSHMQKPCKALGWCVILATSFCGFMFKGPPLKGSIQDDYCLTWTHWARDLFYRDQISFNAGLFIASLLLFTIMALLYKLIRSGRSRAFFILYSLLLGSGIVANDFMKCRILRKYYKPASSLMEDVLAINRWLARLPGNNVLVYFMDDYFSSFSRHMDTFLSTEKRCVYFDAAAYSEGKTVTLDDLPIERADYFIVPNRRRILGDCMFDNVESGPACPNRSFRIYRNLDPNTIKIIHNPKAVFDGKPKRICLKKDGYNGDLFKMSGLYPPESNFSWTEGRSFSLSMGMEHHYKAVTVDLGVAGTFNGPQRYIVRQGDSVLLHGIAAKAGKISFTFEPEGGKLEFQIDFPDAKKISDFKQGSHDHRVIALALTEIRIKAD